MPRGRVRPLQILSLGNYFSLLPSAFLRWSSSLLPSVSSNRCELVRTRKVIGRSNDHRRWRICSSQPNNWFSARTVSSTKPSSITKRWPWRSISRRMSSSGPTKWWFSNRFNMNRLSSRSTSSQDRGGERPPAVRILDFCGMVNTTLTCIWYCPFTNTGLSSPTYGLLIEHYHCINRFSFSGPWLRPSPIYIWVATPPACPSFIEISSRRIFSFTTMDWVCVWQTSAWLLRSPMSWRRKISFKSGPCVTWPLNYSKGSSLIREKLSTVLISTHWPW